jgi:sugar lactone lactonase YvrE
MRTSLALAGNALWVAHLAPRARVQAFDLDGRALAAGFDVPREGSASTRVAALAVDADRRVWIADAGAGRVRAFSAFGRELAGLPRDDADRPGSFGEPVSVAADGVELDARLLVASRGERRHALQLVDPGGRAIASLRARGEPGRAFRGLGRCALRGEEVWACEPATGLVQVFRRGEFHCAFRPGGSASAVPVAVAPLEGGRAVVALGAEGESALLLCDTSGRVLRALARAGSEPGHVAEPEDVAVDVLAGSDRRTRVFAADCGGQRIQVFNVEGECYGAFARETEERAEGAR